MNLKCIKLDRKINLNPNKENYENLIKKFEDDEKRINLLQNNYELIEYLENEQLTLSSGYYFILIAKDIETLNKQLADVEVISESIVPKMYVELISNKLEIYNFLVNYYYSEANIDQLMWLDLPELISPFYMQERTNMLKIDDKEVQIVAIKSIPPFVDELFFEGVFNLPKVKACINVKDTVDTENLVHVLDSSYQFLLSDRNSTKKLSDATSLDTEKRIIKYWWMI